MRSVLDSLAPESKILIIRLRSLGDCVLTTPALALLHEFRPDLRIAVTVEPRFAPVFAGNPAVERILEPLLAAVADWRPQLCLNLHGGGRSLALTLASRAPWRAGFAHFRGQAVYNVRIPRAQEVLGEERKVHTAEHLASAMFYLGVPRTPIPPARLYARLRPAPRPFAVLHPFASQNSKRWPVDHFLQLAQLLQQRFALEPVFIGDASDDLSPFAGFRTIYGAPLDEIMSLVKSAALFIGNDSGPAHMAAAFGVPVVVLFADSDPEIWGPWRNPGRVLYRPQGIQAISVDEVLEAAAEVRASR